MAHPPRGQVLGVTGGPDGAAPGRGGEREQVAHELHALGELLGRVVGDVADGVQGTHRAVARRPFAVLGGLGAPVRVVHDTVADGVYATVRAVARRAGRGAGSAAHAAAPGAARAVTGHPAGQVALGALGGLVADRLARGGGPFALPAVVRHAGHDVPPTAEALRAAHPGAGPSVAVFVHGLGETEAAWSLRARPPAVTHAERLRRDAGLTPVLVRYPSGLALAENGRALAALLERVVAAWPVPVDELVLVGHSMGGLIARHACAAGVREGHAWPALVRHVVALGTPHLGAPLARAAHAAFAALALAPETRALGALLDLRGPGVHDLRDGGPDLPLPPRARLHVVASTAARDPGGLAGRLAGDLLVSVRSAAGGAAPADVVVLGGIDHLGLLAHPRVGDALVQRLR